MVKRKMGEKSWKSGVGSRKSGDGKLQAGNKMLQLSFGKLRVCYSAWHNQNLEIRKRENFTCPQFKTRALPASVFGLPAKLTVEIE